MSYQPTKDDLARAEKFGSYTLNDLRSALNGIVNEQVAEAGMAAILAATKQMTRKQRIAAAVWVIMGELLTLDDEVSNAAQGQAN